MEAALDGFLDFRKKAQGCRPTWIRPILTAASTISAAAGAAAVPPYTPFSTSTENAILRAAPPYGAKPMNQAWDGAPPSSAVPVFPATATLAAPRRPVPVVTTSRMKPPNVAAASEASIAAGGATGP